MPSPTYDEESELEIRRNDERDNEETPLLRRKSSSPSRESKTTFSIGFLIALTCINGGLQVFFSAVMANLAVC